MEPIAENFKSNVPFKVSVNGCCTTKRATPTTKSGDAENGKYRFATLPCMRNGSFTPLYYFEGMTDVEMERCSIRRAARYSTDGQALLNC